MANVTTEGVTIENVACRTGGGGLGGLLGALVIGKPFADRKGRLDQCVSGPTRIRVGWTASGGAMSKVALLSGPRSAAQCIQRALDGAMAPVAGQCAASLEIGP